MSYNPKSKDKGVPPASAFEPTKAAGGKFNCSMDGYKKMSKEILELVLIIATFSVETFKAMLPSNLQAAVGYAYDFLMGMGSWMGYAVAALYFLSIEYDFGKEVCDASGYGYEVIDGLQVLVNFTEKSSAAKKA